MCEVLKVSRSSFYKFLQKVESRRSVENKIYEGEILKIYTESKDSLWCSPNTQIDS